MADDRRRSRRCLRALVLLPALIGVIAGAASAPGTSTAHAAAALGEDPPVNVALPMISGTVVDGETLGAEAGTWAGSEPISFAYQWRRCASDGESCADVGGATSAKYALAATDVGTTIRVAVTATNVDGASTVSSDPTATVAATPPANAARPAISGIAVDGEKLTADAGAWTGTPPISYTYTWRRCDTGGLNCSTIADAAGDTYALTPDDVGSTIRVRVTATNAAGSVLARSTATAAVAPAPPVNTSLPTISGAARQGETLRADAGAWSGTPPTSYAYVWRRCDAAGASCSTIANAVGDSYTVAPEDVDATIRVRVTATNAVGSVLARSKATTVVTPPCPSFAGRREAGVVSFAAARELSGLAASRRNPQVLWTHNDSGDSERVFAIDAAATYLGEFWISHDSQYDWEDIAVGPGPNQDVTYLYVGSVGGNGGRHTIYAYRAPEPDVDPNQMPVSLTVSSVEKLRMQYPGDEEYNAETLMVDPVNGDLYVVTKSSSGMAKVFRYPAEAQDPAVVYTLDRVKTLQLPGSTTAGDISPDGTEIVVKGYTFTYLWQRPAGVSVASALGSIPCQIPNGAGEAIGFAADGSGYFTVAEGTSKPLYWFARLRE